MSGDAQKSEARVPPNSPDGALLLLARMSEPRFRVLLGEVQSDRGFSRSPTRCSEVGKQTGLQAKQVHALLNLFEDFYGYLNPQDRDVANLRSSVIEILAGFDHLPSLANAAELMPIIAARLELAVAYNREVERRRKLLKLRAGFGNAAVHFETLVDLRPDFSEDRTNIERLVPVMQLRITTNAKAKLHKHVVFQLSTKTLGQLEKALKDLRRKVDQFDKSPGLHGLIEREKEDAGDKDAESV